MRLTLDPTSEVVTLAAEHTGRSVQARIWKGTDENGVEVHAYVALVQPQTHDPDVAAAFGERLRQIPVERRMGAIDFRFFIG